MLDLPFAPDQPSLEGFVQRMGGELNARAVVVVHENGQVLSHTGWIEDHDYPPLAALVVAMLAAGKSLHRLGESFPGAPSRFACESEEAGLYTVAVTSEIWLAVLYDQPLNPGQFRMKVRGYAEALARLGVKKPEQWEVENDTGAKLPPGPVLPEKKSSLFSDISDEEIDELFENARS